MKFPYGIANFHAIRTENYFYVDRTDRIPLIEDAGKQLLLLRPRRFGKSLWLSTLEHYYDLARADDFNKLFGGLKISENATPLHNSYFILKLNFSVVDPRGDTDAIVASFFHHININIQNCVSRYQDLLADRVQIYVDDGIASFQSLLGAVAQTQYKLYLLVDEYDNFANEVMMRQISGNDYYLRLVENEGTIKTFFKAVKAGAENGALDRVFLTGISPVVMSDMTSGYNVVQDITLLDEYHHLCGFTAEELSASIRGVLAERGMSDAALPDIIEMLQWFYNGYRFGESDNPRIYNPTLALYFLDYFSRYGRYPQRMLDDNLAMDRNRIQYVARLAHGEKLVTQALNEAQPVSVAQLVNRFGVQDMLHAPRDPDFLATLLYYFGVLTMSGRDAIGKLQLTIPNQVIRKLYAERLAEQALPRYEDQEQRQAVVERFYTTGAIEELLDLLEQTYFKVFDNRDLRWNSELALKVAFLVVLFNDAFYIMHSEPALGRGYGDLFMQVRPDMRQYNLRDHLFEFEALTLKELGLNSAALATKTREELRELPAVVEKLREAQTQLAIYRETLERDSRQPLQLHTHAVVGIGLERLVGTTDHYEYAHD